MMRKLSRRNFLKTAGATVLAAAAMSTLTACGGGGGSTTPSTNSVPDKQLGELKLKDVKGGLFYSYDADDPTETPTDWGAYLNVTLENTKNQAIELNSNNATILLDGRVPQNDKVRILVRDETDTSRWRELRDPLVKVENGKPITIRIKVKFEKSVYEQWTKGEGNHSLSVTLKYDNKKVTYGLDSKRTTTVGNVENA